MLFGVDYYPEHWPQERWRTDVELMANAGINIVRLAEFAWSRLEPAKGRYEFAWLDRVCDFLHSHGIGVILGTPTAAPPAWLVSSEPSILAVHEDGREYTFGNRCFYCPGSSAYRSYVSDLVSAMAGHYRNHPGVSGWQIDNEFATRCYCESCRRRFQDWLQTRYETLENLNTAWGTVFWSQEYSEWSQIPLPWSTGGHPNPGLALDYRRFMSREYLDFLRMQKNILRETRPDWQLTHNFMGFHVENLDYGLLARELDVPSWDNYPAGSPSPLEQSALGHAVTRGYSKGGPFWVMESQSGPGGWDCLAPGVYPGQMRQWAWQAIAHGADGVIFFRWRTCLFGTEQYWHGILDHDGVPRERYEELSRMGGEVARIGKDLSGIRVHSEIALVNNYDVRFAFQVQPSSPGFRWSHHAAGYFNVLHRRGHSVDVLLPEDDFTSYSLTILPAHFLIDESLAERLRGYVDRGGILVATFRTGVKDMHNRIRPEPLPGLLREIFGISITRYESLRPGETMEIRMDSGENSPEPARHWKARTWRDFIEPEGADTLAVYTDPPYADSVAVTRNRFGKGLAYYVGTEPEETYLTFLADEFLQAAGIPLGPLLPEGVETAVRGRGDQRTIFVFNGTGEERIVPVSGSAIEMLREETVRDSIHLEPYGVAVLKDIED